MERDLRRGLLSAKGKSVLSCPFEGLELVDEFTRLLTGSMSRRHEENQAKLSKIMRNCPGFCCWVDVRGKPAIHYLIELGLVEMVDFSLKNGAAINFFDKKSKVGPLEVGANASLEMVEFLIDNGAGLPKDNLFKIAENTTHLCELVAFLLPLVELKTIQIEEIFHLCIKQKKNSKKFPPNLLQIFSPKIDTKKVLSKIGGEPSPKTTLLHSAFFWNQKDVVNFLLKKGDDINQLVDGYSPICFAVSGLMQGHYEPKKLEKWIKRGADLDIGEGEKKPLVVAVKSGRHLTVQFLIEKGARIFLDLPDRNSLYHYSETGTVDDALFEAGLPINLTNSENETAILYHFRRNYENKSLRSYGNEQQLAVFLKNGGDPNLFDLKKKTLLYYAVQEENAKYAQLLLDNKADMGLVQPSALIVAVKYGKGQQVIPLLLSRGCDLYEKDEQGKTAIQIAELNHRVVTVSQIKHHQQPQVNVKPARR